MGRQPSAWRATGWRAVRAAVVAAACGALAAASAAEQDDASLRDRVRRAALATYIHGMTDDIAAREVGAEGIPILIELLADPDFPRRDNVVAFLSHVDRGSATAALQDFLDHPPAPVTAAAEDRALLITPQALGRIAARGDPRALRYLLEVTAPGERGGPLNRPLAAGAIDEGLRDDLVEAALRGLALSRLPEAERRLVAISESTAAPILEKQDFVPQAKRELAILRADPSGDGRPYDHGAAEEPAPRGGQVHPLLDAAVRSHDSALSWATHATIPVLLVGSVERELAHVSKLIATEDSSADVACCVRFSRSGAGGHFGVPGDGLDIIDGAPELEAVLENPVARVKVVREIRWCGGPGTNIIGCAKLPGRGIAAVEISRYGVLWVHEYGHNVGLGHRLGSSNIMSPTMSEVENAVSGAECAAFHAPPPEAAAIVSNIGACEDADADRVVSSVDNCLEVANHDQDDRDLDLVGQACDNCPFSPNFDQLDGDGDEDGNVCDSCHEEPNPDQLDTDLDGLGDACDICLGVPNDFDADGRCSDTDNCRIDPNPDQADSDADGLGDACDPCAGDTGNDPDADGRCAAEDVCPVDADVTAPRSARVPMVWDGAPNQPRVAVGDVNGDGFTDVMMGHPTRDPNPITPRDEGVVFVHLGSATGYPTWPSQWLYGTEAFDGFGSALASGGDVNGDGFDDVVVGTKSRRVDVFYGSDSGLVPFAISLEGTGDAERLDEYGRSVAIVGDVNGDGFDEVAVGVWEGPVGRPGSVRLHLGSAGGAQIIPSKIFRGEHEWARFGMTISHGDFDRDGLDDLVIAAPEAREEDLGVPGGRVYVYRGTAGGPVSEPSWIATGTGDYARFGDSLAAADVDGDGHQDLVVGAPAFSLQESSYDGAVYVYSGSSAGLSLEPRAVRYGSSADARFGKTLAALGDLDGDGRDDLAVGSTMGRGIVHVYGGSPTGLESQPRWQVSGTEDTARLPLGYLFLGAGDADGDGLTDLFVDGSFARNFREERVMSVFPGGSGGFATAPQPDRDADGLGDACDEDRDGDGVPDAADNCPEVDNAAQLDSNVDGVGDACDADADGVADDADNCPQVANPDQYLRLQHVGRACDADNDGTTDAADTCPTVANFLQADTDADGAGDACDDDDDGDGLFDDADNCDTDADASQSDLDGDTIGDLCDHDADGDGHLNILDNCPATFNAPQEDRDADRLGDACDPCTDLDRDGVGLAGSPCGSAQPDCDDTDAAIFPGNPDLCDGRDNDCDLAVDEARCGEFDIDADGRVDGREVAWLARAFGLCSPAPASQWWFAVDYSSDGCIDGDDLAVLAVAWSCLGQSPLCR